MTLSTASTFESHREKLFAALKRRNAKKAGESARAGIEATRDMLLGVMDK